MLDTAEGAMNDLASTDRKIVGILLGVALLTFFLPLMTFQIPILGNRDVSGYDIFSKAQEYDKQLDAFNSKEFSKSSRAQSQSSEDNREPAGEETSVPFSAQTLPLIPYEVFGGFLSALIALLRYHQIGIKHLFSFNPRYTIRATVSGSIFAVMTIIHISIANSDLHTWFQEQINASSHGLTGSPFDNITQTIENMAANAFQIKPGIGLYILAAALILANIFLYSRNLSAVTSDEKETPLKSTVVSGEPAKQLDTSVLSFEPTKTLNSSLVKEKAKIIAFSAIIGVLLVIAIIVLMHKPTQSRFSVVVPESITLDTSMRHRVLVNPFSPENPPTAMRTANGEWSQAILVYSSTRADVYIATKEIDSLISARPLENWNHSGFGILILSDFKPDARSGLAKDFNVQAINAENFRYIEHATFIDTDHSKITTVGLKLIDTYGESFFTSPEIRENNDLTDPKNTKELDIVNGIVRILSAKTNPH
jgi:hypothetical protein